MIELRRLGRPIIDAMLTGFAYLRAGGRIRDSRACRWAHRGNAGVQRLVQRVVQVLLRRAPRGNSLRTCPCLIAATGGTERHSLVLEHALRPMFSYLHAVVSPTGVYAATDDFGAGGNQARPE